jgi:superfamily II DNA/RNA helicase
VTKTFRDLGVDPALCDALAEGGITHPFPIQELTLPLALDGHDLIGQARTGTGKTLAFGLPLLQRLDPSSKHTQALVIVPTRELCLQVYSDLQIGSALGLSSISVYGGVGYDEQIDALTAGAHVVVGTPGRLLDLLNRGVLDLSHVTQLVLDEADEMLDMGFLPDVERLVESCKGEDRHTMLFSATMPTAIVKLARRYMDHPTFTRADHEQKNTAPLVTQYFFEVHRMDKPRLLARILQSKDRGGVYVFVRTKHMADRLVNDLEELRIPSIAIHGDLRQSTREKNLDRFRSGQATVLVCTEVAARGLDVTGVTHVINYDCPDDEKMYLHRIGRTARAGEAGVAITFAEFNEKDRLNVIRKAVGATDTEVQQVFSTSKQLAEMFELPEQRPWDHLSTKAGSDEARAKRESRTDGKPKSGRTHEGRGGDHDARGSGDRDKGRGKGRGRGDDAPRASAAKSDAKSDAPIASKPDAPVESKADTPERSQAGDTSPKRGSGDGQPTAPRDRDRRGARSRDRKSGGARSEAATSAVSDTDTATTDERRESGEVVRTRTRTRARSSSGETSSRDTGPRGTASRDTASRDTASADQERPAPSTDTGGDTATDRDEAADASASSGKPRRSSGRQRARGGNRNGGQRHEAKGRDEPASGESRGGDTSDAGRSGGDRSAGDRQQERGKDRSARDADGRDRKRTDGGSRGGRSRGGSRDGGRSDRGGRATESEGTVTVAKRGEDARGDGRPQIARRVKIEHLP